MKAATPRVAEICSSLCTSKSRGREPKLSWLASVAADSLVNVPEIMASPLAIGLLTEGAETTRPSRTIANLSLIHISEPTRLGMISYAVFCLKKKKNKNKKKKKQKQ